MEQIAQFLTSPGVKMISGSLLLVCTILRTIAGNSTLGTVAGYVADALTGKLFASLGLDYAKARSSALSSKSAALTAAPAHQLPASEQEVPVDDQTYLPGQGVP